MDIHPLSLELIFFISFVERQHSTLCLNSLTIETIIFTIEQHWCKNFSQLWMVNASSIPQMREWGGGGCSLWCVVCVVHLKLILQLIIWHLIVYIIPFPGWFHVTVDQSRYPPLHQKLYIDHLVLWFVYLCHDWEFWLIQFQYSVTYAGE